MASEKNQSFVVENGVTLGVIVLALFVIFAVGLPRWIGGDDADSAIPQSKIVLPDTLSGGYAAADLTSSWTPMKGLKDNNGNAFNDATAKQQATQINQSIEAANKSLGKALTGAATTRAYIKASNKGLEGVVNVQAFRASGGAFAPADLGVGGSTLAKVGDGVCSTTQQSSSSGQAVSDVTCQRSGSQLTVQVNGQGMPGNDVMKYVDEVWGKVA